MKKFAILITLLAVFLSGCHLSNLILRKKMLEKYSDDQNYVTLTGEVIEFKEHNVTIECEELQDYISYQSKSCIYHIYSNHFIELSVGEQIEFTTVPWHFYNGHRLPIVELKIDGNILLSFEEGKENLIEWVNTNFK